METTIISGKENAGIDPVLTAWHWEIPLYLFLGGLAAGVLFFSAFFFLLKKEKQFPATVINTVPVAPIAIVIGLMALMLDLTHKPFFWRLYTTFKIESPMSWGAWVLMVITPISVLWSLDGFKVWMPGLFGKFNWLNRLLELKRKFNTTLAWALLVLALILGVYTGILLSAFNARPLWNTSVLGFLFLISGLSTGAALILMFSTIKDEKKLIAQIDLVLIGLELFLITHMFMGFMAGSAAKIQAAQLFLGGPYTMPFWLLVVGLGLVLPAVLELMSLRHIKVPKLIPPMLILLGGVAFRFIIVYAGQVSAY